MTHRSTIGRAACAAAACLALLLTDASTGSAQTTYTVTGTVLKIEPSRTRFLVAHEAVPGLMPAMTMTLDVRDARELEGIASGSTIVFTLRVGKGSAYAEQVRPVRADALELDAPAAGRPRGPGRRNGLTAEPAGTGETVGDFTLVDQARRPVTLSHLRGKVVAVTFVSTTCAQPDPCPDATARFANLEQRFRSVMGTDLILLTVALDTGREIADALAGYAAARTTPAAHWHFLSGTPADIERVTRLFGVGQSPGEAATRTAVIDRAGRLIASVDESSSGTRLEDLIAAALGPRR